MRVSFHSTAAVIALGATLGFAAPVLAEGASPGGNARQDNAARPTADQHEQGSQSSTSKSGQGGKEEPGSHAPSADGPVFVNGRLDAPGAPADSQTVPAKFSARNDKLDNMPIMATSLGLTDQQKRAIADAVGRGNAPVAQIASKPADELPWGVAIHDLPNASTDPTLPDVKYVRTPDRILLVRPSNRIVVGEIAK